MDQSSQGRPAVVITGASTGIGAASATELARHGFSVFAGVRKQRDGERLTAQSGHIVPLLLDVTNSEQIASAAETVCRSVGDAGLAGLVNNAGIVVAGPLEILPLDQLRLQLEVNVVGQIAVTQAFLPLLRKARGRIVNMSSLNGRIASPYLAPYAASKHALEAVNNAIRLELRAWGIRVLVIEPGATTTPIWDKAIAAADALADKVKSGRSTCTRAISTPCAGNAQVGACGPAGRLGRALRRSCPDRAAALRPLSGWFEGESAAAGLQVDS